MYCINYYNEAIIKFRLWRSGEGCDRTTQAILEGPYDNQNVTPIQRLRAAALAIAMDARIVIFRVFSPRRSQFGTISQPAAAAHLKTLVPRL